MSLPFVIIYGVLYPSTITQVLDAIAAYPNICKMLHMPAQSGSDSCLQRMKRGYTKEGYLNLINEV